MNPTLDTMDHVAIAVHDIKLALDWYSRSFQYELLYQDATWALLQFANIKLALVLPYTPPILDSSAPTPPTSVRSHHTETERNRHTSTIRTEIPSRFF